MTPVGSKRGNKEPSSQGYQESSGLEGPSIPCGSSSGRKGCCHLCSRLAGLRVQGPPQLCHEFDHSLGHMRPYFQNKRTGQFSQPPDWGPEPGDFDLSRI